jgi:hypothetical protein
MISYTQAGAIRLAASSMAVCLILASFIARTDLQGALSLQQDSSTGQAETVNGNPPPFSSLPRVLQRIGMRIGTSQTQGDQQHRGRTFRYHGGSARSTHHASPPPDASMPTTPAVTSASMNPKSDIPSDTSLRDLAFSYMTEDDQNAKPPSIHHLAKTRESTGKLSMEKTRIRFSQTGFGKRKGSRTQKEQEGELKKHIAEQLRKQALLAKKARKASLRAAKLKDKVKRVEKAMVKQEERSTNMWNKLTDAVSSFDVASKDMLRKSEQLD